MKAVLIYPPLSNPRSPYLSLPALSAYLRMRGHQVKIRDLNLDLFYECLNEEAIRREGLVPEEKKLLLEALPGLQEARAMVFERHVSPGRIKEAKKRLRWAYRRLFEEHEANIHRRSVNEILSHTLDQRHEKSTFYYMANIIPWLQKENPALVGISIPFPSQWVPAFELARAIKQRLPHIHITLGGPQITKLANHLASYHDIFEFIDSLVIHDGERPLAALLNVLEEHKPLSGVPNLIYRQGSRTVHNPTASPEPMNHLPTPDFQGLHLDRYLLGTLMIPLIASRGCYWGKCSFCTYREIHHHAVELRDPSLVVEDMKALSEKCHSKYFRIVDDALSPRSCKALSNAILGAGLHIKWKCSARLEKAFTLELCRLMARAGCDKVLFGLESYNQRVLNLMNKGIWIAHVKPILKDFKTAGIKTHLSCMIGFPTETRAEALETKRFLEENRDLYTTLGVQSFSLEDRTEIDRCPENFGITRIFREDKIRHGLRYGYRFETESGLSRKEAEEITRQIQLDL